MTQSAYTTLQRMVLEDVKKRIKSEHDEAGARPSSPVDQFLSDVTLTVSREVIANQMPSDKSIKEDGYEGAVESMYKIITEHLDSISE